MKKQFLVYAILSIFIVSCYENDLKIENSDDKVVDYDGISRDTSLYEQGTFRIHITEELSEVLEENLDQYGYVISTKVGSLSSELAQFGVVKMKRTFPHAGRFEERTRAEGLHLWYDVTFDDNIPLTRAGSTFESMEGVNFVEYSQKMIHYKGEVVEESVTFGYIYQNSSDPIFNDPRLKEQWHYRNTSNSKGSEPGCDINVLPVWQNYTVGNQDVIVSVVDAGIDYSHEDLSANMWRNPDKQGEMVYGYNFYNDNYRITPGTHGTHVAGTISAVNNNGIGVCGIAGGDAENSIPGVKLMSCQIFPPDSGEGSGSGSGSGAAAIKWGADHGAVISQNSWGYEYDKDNPMTSIPSSDKAAIDYFNKYAGIDEYGNQVGPMKGGVVIFAAGNDNMDLSFPAAYEGCISVGSVGADYRRAYYSNYGSWVDVAAPGGDVEKGFQVLSTLPGNKYGFLQGTSMACPHVSGVAALIISYKGGPGFTNDMLRDRIESFTTDIYSYNKNFPIGNLVNSYLAVVGNEGIAPDQIEEIECEALSNNIIVTVKVPADEDDQTPSTLLLSYSSEPFDSIHNGLRYKTLDISSYNVGDYVNDTIKELEFNTKYFVRANAVDLAGNKSPYSELCVITTKENNYPTITPEFDGDIIIKAMDNKYFNYSIVEPDYQKITISFETNSEAVTFAELSNSKVQVNINGAADEPGIYNFKIIVTDAYGLSSDYLKEFTILDNIPPVKIKDIEDIILPSLTSNIQIPVNEYFTDEDGEQLSIKITTDNGVANINYSDGYLYITPLRYGIMEATVVASDVKGKSVSTTFKVLIRDGSQEIDIYPNPVIDKLNIRTPNESTAKVRIINNLGSIIVDSNLSISPFTPGVVDMTQYSAGVYRVIVENNGKVYERNIVKL